MAREDLGFIEDSIYETLDDVDQCEIDDLMEDGFDFYEALEELGLI